MLFDPSQYILYASFFTANLKANSIYLLCQKRIQLLSLNTYDNL